MQPSLKIELNACVVSIFLRQNKERINNVFDSDFYCSVFDLTFFFSGYLPYSVWATPTHYMEDRRTHILLLY